MVLTPSMYITGVPVTTVIVKNKCVINQLSSQHNSYNLAPSIVITKCSTFSNLLINHK